MTETDLMELARKVEALEGACRETDALIKQAVGDSWDYAADWGPRENCNPVAKPYTASIDAAMSLVPEGWNWMAGNRNQPDARAYVENNEMAFEGAGFRKNPARIWHEVVAAAPAIALCAAALRARASLSRLSPPNEVPND